MHLRNQPACLYLQDTDYPIQEIAKLCGYYEEYHFSKMFKQMNGVSPSAYRAAKRDGSPSVSDTSLTYLAVDCSPNSD